MASLAGWCARVLLLGLRVASLSRGLGGSQACRVGWRPGASFHGLASFSLHGKQLTKNWIGQGESDCLIKTKHCDWS